MQQGRGPIGASRLHLVPVPCRIEPRRRAPALVHAGAGEVRQSGQRPNVGIGLAIVSPVEQRRRRHTRRLSVLQPVNERRRVRGVGRQPRRLRRLAVVTGVEQGRWRRSLLQSRLQELRERPDRAHVLRQLRLRRIMLRHEHRRRSLKLGRRERGVHPPRRLDQSCVVGECRRPVSLPFHQSLQPGDRRLPRPRRREQEAKVAGEGARRSRLVLGREGPVRIEPGVRPSALVQPCPMKCT
jgi:hypothetical protein